MPLIRQHLLQFLLLLLLILVLTYALPRVSNAIATKVTATTERRLKVSL